MDSILKRLIENVVEASHGSSEEQEAIRKELTSHVIEEVRELQLQGHTEERAVEMVQTRFGDPASIGQQFFAVQHHFDRIPWIGPLLSYPPLISAFKLFCLHVLLGIVWFSGIVYRVLESIQVQYLNPSSRSATFESYRQLDLTEPIVFLSLAAIIPLLEGRWLRSLASRYGQFFEIALLSYMPFLILIAGYIFNQIIEGDLIFTSMESSIPKSIVIGLMFHCVVMHAGWIAFSLLARYRINVLHNRHLL